MEQLIFSKYKYDPDKDFLGKGAFADIYRAYDVLLERYVALKFYRTTENQAESKYDVINEMKRMIRLQIVHPNLITYYDALLLPITDSIGRSFPVQIGVLEYANGKESLLTGGDLRTYINRMQPNDGLIKKIAADILQGLLYLEQHQIVHRDLKPANILMHRQPNGEWKAKIADFGLSKSLNSEEESSVHLKGTIEYMAPEQFYPNKYGNGQKISTNADLWAFGAILYEIFTGSLPFGKRSQGSTDAQILANVDGFDSAKLTMHAIPEPFRQVISRCLVKHAAQRAQTAQELLNILNGSNTPFAEMTQTSFNTTPPVSKEYKTPPPKQKPPLQKETQNNTGPSKPSNPTTAGNKVFKIVVGTALALIAFWVIQQLFGDPLAGLFSNKDSIFDSADSDTLTTISVSQNIVSLGELTQGKKAVRTIYLKNTGVHPLNINKVTAFCPCISADWQPKQAVLPNDSVALNFTLSTDNLTGAFTDSIMWYANTFTNPSSLLINGYVKKPFIPERDDYSGIKEKLKEVLTFYHQYRNDTLYFDDIFTNPLKKYYSETGYLSLPEVKNKVAFQAGRNQNNTETVQIGSVNYVILDGNYLADYVVTENNSSSGSWFGGGRNQIKMEAEITYPDFKIIGIRSR
jgi:serine/threonine protein kinase